MQRGGGTEWKNFHPLVHSPGYCNGWCCNDLKPGARGFLQVSHMGAGSHGFGPSSTAFPSHKQGAGWEVELLGHEVVSIWDPSTCKGRTSDTRLLCWILA